MTYISKDYCSCVPDGIWGNVCKEHDVNYAFIRKARLLADKEFFKSLYIHSRIIAYVYYIGVRILGRLFV